MACPRCLGWGYYWDEKIEDYCVCDCPPEYEQESLTGKYHGNNATPTERSSGEEIERNNFGPLKPGGAGHMALQAYADGERRTAYDASVVISGDYHALRRESTRLVERGFLVDDGTLPNHAPRGRKHVQARRITTAGLLELQRLTSDES